MAYIPPASYCELCLMSDSKICERCDFNNEEEFEEEEEFG